MSECDFSLVVLGAGKPHVGHIPAALGELQTGGSVLNWILGVTRCPRSKTTFVAGYQSELIKSKFPELAIIENQKWSSTLSGFSLSLPDLNEEEALLVTYSDILFREDIVERLSRVDADIVVAFDGKWESRFSGSDVRDLIHREKVKIHGDKIVSLGRDVPAEWATGEFIGLVWFSKSAVKFLNKQFKKSPKMFEKCQLSDCVEFLRTNGLSIAGIDVKGDWAEYRYPDDIAQFILGTKAETLGRLKTLLANAKILDQVSFAVEDWKKDPNKIVSEIALKFPNDPLVVRSSALAEDSFNQSNAGRFESLLNVQQGIELCHAINQVVSSYVNPLDVDQVLVQPMLKDVVISGVLFTRTLEYGAPWYVVNYEESGSTDGITSGTSRNHKTTYLRRDIEIVEGNISDRRLLQVFHAVKEIENILEFDNLDIEFAIDANDDVYILQVRPIAVSLLRNKPSDENYYELLEASKQRWTTKELALPHFPQGAPPLYGIMPDWNPAEIIGTIPTNLSSSLYSSLIMDDVWSQQRAEFGYKNIGPAPLLENFSGHAYVDVRASFASFIPASLGNEISDKLLKFYTERLINNPASHDKVEFDIVATCLSPSFEIWRERFIQSGLFSYDETEIIRSELRKISSHAFFRPPTDLATIEKLTARYNDIMASHEIEAIDRAWLLLEDCKRFGTLPFAHLARSGFVAVTLLREAVEIGVLSAEARDNFMASIKTVGHDLMEDANKVKACELEWSAFIDKYGHLRPGTYDITSPRYDSDIEKYLKPLVSNVSEPESLDENLHSWNNEKTKFCHFLSNLELPSEPSTVEEFLRQAIEGREYAKFVFSRNLSAALEAISEVGKEFGLDRMQLSHISIEEIFSIRNSLLSKEELTKKLEVISDRNARLHDVCKGIPLPTLITSIKDFDCFTSSVELANFVGSRTVTAKFYDFSTNESNQLVSLKGLIIMIPQADPGYDWLFGHEIAGLITMFGGANSHMAIRAAEFSLPAAIGVGEQKYKELIKSNLIRISPETKSLQAL